MAEIKSLQKIVQLNTVQLISKIDSKLYSIQVRDKLTRSFVQITDRTISSDADGCIISRNAICYVDTCKYDSHEVNISCKHIKNALESNVMADALSIAETIWYSMTLPDDVKTRLWCLYNEANDKIPMVQRINRTMFVVKCDVSASFPAGRLHVHFNGGGYEGKSKARYFI